MADYCRRIISKNFNIRYECGEPLPCQFHKVRERRPISSDAEHEAFVRSWIPWEKRVSISPSGRGALQRVDADGGGSSSPLPRMEEGLW